MQMRDITSKNTPKSVKNPKYLNKIIKEHSF